MNASLNALQVHVIVIINPETVPFFRSHLRGPKLAEVHIGPLNNNYRVGVGGCWW